MKLVLLIIFIAISILGCRSKEMKKAIQYMDVKMYKEAISLLEIELQDKPKNAEASYLLGICYLNDKNPELAEKNFKRSILLETSYKEKIAMIYYNESINLYKKNYTFEAHNLYKTGLKYSPTDKNIVAKELLEFIKNKEISSTQISDIFSMLEIISDIDKDYDKAIGSFCYDLSLKMLDKKLIEEALNYGQEGMKYDIDGANKYAKELYSFTIKFSETSTDVDIIIRLFQTINQITSEFNEKIATQSYNYGVIFFNKGFEDDALKYLREGIKFDPIKLNETGKFYFDYAKSLLNKKEYYRAINYFEFCLKVTPNKNIEIAEILKKTVNHLENTNQISIIILYAEKSYILDSNNKRWYMDIKQRYKKTISDDGLIAYFPFNNNTSDSFNNQVYEASKYNYTTNRFGDLKSAIVFSRENDHLITENYNISSISFWIKTDVENETNGVLGQRFNSNEEKNNWQIIIRKDNSIQLNYYYPTYNTITSDKFVINDNNWHNVTVTSGHQGLKVFFDSILIMSVPSYRNILGGFPNTHKLAIGATGDNGKWLKYRGHIDDLRIYRKELSMDEIKTIYDN